MQVHVIQLIAVSLELHSIVSHTHTNARSEPLTHSNIETKGATVGAERVLVVQVVL